MDLKEIIQKAESQHDLNQTELAKKIGLQPTALSHILGRRRKLPAEAAIELSELTGYRAKAVWEAAQRWARAAACAVLAAGAGVMLTLTPAPAEANMARPARFERATPAFGGRGMKRAAAAALRMLANLAGKTFGRSTRSDGNPTFTTSPLRACA